MAKEKVVLAYSGGLDTSIIIPWLIENYGYEVIAVCGDVGQGKETDGLEERAKRSGASKCYIEDLRDEYVEDYIVPTLKAGAVYEGKYLLGTSHARPIIAKKLVEIAEKEGVSQRTVQDSLELAERKIKIFRENPEKYLSKPSKKLYK